MTHVGMEGDSGGQGSAVPPISACCTEQSGLLSIEMVTSTVIAKACCQCHANLPPPIAVQFQRDRLLSKGHQSWASIIAA